MKTEINLHLSDFFADFTLEFNVKRYSFQKSTMDAFEHLDVNMVHECHDIVAESLGKECFAEIQKKVKTKKIQFIQYAFAGRSGGWYVITCSGVEPYANSPVVEQVKGIVEKYLNMFEKRLVQFIKSNS